MKIKLIFCLCILAIIYFWTGIGNDVREPEASIGHKDHINESEKNGKVSEKTSPNNRRITVPKSGSDSTVQSSSPKIEVIKGKIDMNAPGKGNALFMSLALNHGSVELGYAISVPVKSVRKASLYANYLAVIKDSNGESIQKIPLRLQGRRAVLSEPGAELSNCTCEDGSHFMEGSMRFEKFNTKAHSLAVFKIEKPFTSSRESVTFEEFVEEEELTLIEEVKL